LNDFDKTQMSTSFLRPLLQDTPGKLVIRNLGNRQPLAHHLIGAFDSKSRRTGLLHHQSLPEGSAMVIAPTSAVHTFFMRFAIDVAFVARDGRVTKTYASLPPWRIAGAFGSHVAIELPAGTLARCDTAAGDMLAITPDEQV
jgi:uncharacterized membrane protein (UPF0127 family)